MTFEEAGQLYHDLLEACERYGVVTNEAKGHLGRAIGAIEDFDDR